MAQTNLICLPTGDLSVNVVPVRIRTTVAEVMDLNFDTLPTLGHFLTPHHGK
jgi:hypothetical protein